MKACEIFETSEIIYNIFLSGLGHYFEKLERERKGLIKMSTSLSALEALGRWDAGEATSLETTVPLHLYNTVNLHWWFWRNGGKTNSGHKTQLGYLPSSISP